MRSSIVRPLALVLPFVTLSCDRSPTAPSDSPACANVTTTFTVVTVPVVFDEVGTLTDASCELGRGTFADRYELIVPVAVDIVIDLVSDDLDAFIILRNSDDKQIGSDDDRGSGGFNDGNAQLGGRLQAGTYYIMATTYADGQVGDYALTITVEPIPIE